MRYLLILMILKTASCISQEAVFFIKHPKYVFKDTIQNVKIRHDFEFENRGDAPLLITGYDVECTCTEIILPEQAIQPNQKGIITLIFDTKDKLYLQNRLILLETNGKKKIVKLKFKVFVKPND